MKSKSVYLFSSLLLATPLFAQSNDVSRRPVSKQRLDVLSTLVDKPDGENSVMSAASLDGLLSIVGFGYEGENKAKLENYLSKSVSQSAKGLSALNTKADGITVSSAQNIWAQEDFHILPEYLEAVKTNFNGLVPGKLNIADPDGTADEINKWIGDRTNNMLGPVVASDLINSDLASLLVDALYFKGTWESEFDKTETKDADFFAVTKADKKVSKQTVPTMYKYANNIEIASFKEGNKVVSVVRLPYKGKNHAMYLAFAQKVATDDFNKNFSVDTTVPVEAVYREMIANGTAFTTKYSPVEYTVFSMPKFTIESKIDFIHEDLAKNGLASLFEKKALSKLTDDPRARLAFIFQKAKIIVNEEGAEAAAATVGGIATESIAAPTQTLRIDGPFTYAIRDDKNRVTLFEGIVRNPK